MDVNSEHSLLVTNNFFPNFLNFPLEIQSRIIFLSVVTNLPKQSNSNNGAFSAKSPLVKTFTKTAKALHSAIDNVFCYTIKLEYIDKHSFNIKFALYTSLENKDKIDTRIFTKTELEHLSKDECSLLYPKILKEDNVEAFNSLLNNKNFTPDLYAYYWLLALNKLKEADVLLNKIQNTEEDLDIKENVFCNCFTQNKLKESDVLLNKIQNTEEDLNIRENEYSDFTPKKFKEINDFISKKEKEMLDIGENACSNGFTPNKFKVMKDLVSKIQRAKEELDTWENACSNGFAQIVKYFMEVKKINPSLSQTYILNDIVTRFAVDNGYSQIANIILLVIRINPAPKNNNAIRSAAENGQDEVVKLLLADKRVDPCDEDNYAIRSAVKKGHINVLELILADERVDAVAYNLALNEAILNGRLKIVKFLLENKRFKKKVHFKALTNSIQTNQLEILKLLLCQIDPTEHSCNILTLAAKLGNADIVNYLLNESRFDPSLNSNATLREAVKNNHLEIVKNLLRDDRVDPSEHY